jgi:16S rRNA (guanine1516-N2)-methyltransferase
MNLHFLHNGQLRPAATADELQLAQLYAEETPQTLEWINGQYWWHSNRSGEKPIGIEVDRELERHEQFFRKSSIQKELLARAIGVKGPHRPQVWDLTAGLLGDSLLFLSFGCQVRAIERHPMVAFLIRSALANAHHPALARLEFCQADAEAMLANSEQVPEVLYYDPMFNEVNEKSSPRKEMRIFREFVGKDQDARHLVEVCLARAPKRLVVKRPRLAEPLVSRPAVQFTGKATRYDVYFGQNTRPFESIPLK